MRATGALCVAALLLLALASNVHAAAPYRLAVLELESDDVHDNFAGELAERVRHVLATYAGYKVRDAHVSLVQLSLAQDCNTAQADCLAKIARELELDGFVFGKVTHEGGAPVAVLRRYDVKTRAVDRSALVTFPSREVSGQQLDRGVDQLVNELLGTSRQLTHKLLELPAPAEDHEEASAAETPGEAHSGPSTQRIAAYALLAGSVLTAGMAVVSFVQVHDAQHDVVFNQYRIAVGDQAPTVRDVCSEANAGKRYGLDAGAFREVKSSCSAGSTFEILQFVFLGAAVVTGGLGSYLWFSDESTEKNSDHAQLRLKPRVARNMVGLDARLMF